MSDPMTNTDVEDVLASIRRLVSDDGRKGVASVQRPPSDRLVLTPSLRVTEGGDAEGSDAHDASAQDQNPEPEPEIAAFADDPHPKPDPYMIDDEALASFVHSAFRKAEPDRAASVTHEESDAPASEIAQDAIALPDDAPFADVEDVPMADIDTDAADTAREEAANIMRDDRLHAGAAQDSADADDIIPETARVPEDWNGAADETPEVAPCDGPPEPTSRPATQSLSEKIAALETLVGARRDQFEPDDLGADAYAGTEPPAMEWEDAEADADEPVEHMGAQNYDLESEFDLVDVTPQEADKADRTKRDAGDVTKDMAGHEPIPESEFDVADGTPDEDGSAPMREGIGETVDADDTPAALFGHEDDVLDEDALRELVSDIVREELQGALGERITRNVRKLVRREIHRALAAQDLE